MSGSFVYFIKPVGAPGPVKIGCSEYPVGRLDTLMAWSPVPLELVVTIPGGTDLERNLHECFSDQHSHREWFHASARISALMNSLQNGVPISEAVDLSKRLGTIRTWNRGKKASPERRRFLSYNRRLWQAAKNLAVGQTDCHYVQPHDTWEIMERWRGNNYHKNPHPVIPPTAEELARLDEVLANPAAHFVRYEHQWKKDAAA